MPQEPTAVIDLGSNSIRIVLYELGPRGIYRELDDLKQVVRLNNYLDSRHVLSEEGIARTVRTIGEFKLLCDAYHVTQIIGVATQSVRVAVNRSVLLERIWNHTGIAFQVITGEEEAQFGYLAAVNTLPYDTGMTVDIGGASTEITYFTKRQLRFRVSIPYGAMSLTQQYLQHDRVTAKDRQALEGAIRKELDRLLWTIDAQGPVIGIGGTARALARMHQRRTDYPLKTLHGYPMSSADVSTVLDMVRSTPVHKRHDISGLSRDRADIIEAGITIVDQLMKRAAARAFVLSTKGIRDGVLLERVLGRRDLERWPDMLGNSIDYLMEHFHLNRDHAFHVWRMVDQLFSEMTEHQWMNGTFHRPLKAAALLHDLGSSISIYNTSSHTFYLLLQVPMFGLSHRERIIAAAIAAFKSPKQIGSLLRPYQTLLNADEITAIHQLGVLLGLVRSLDRTHRGAVTRLRLTAEGESWKIWVASERMSSLELNIASDWVKRARRAFQREVILEVEMP